MQKLLDETLELEEEVTWLIADMKEALKTREVQGIEPNLKRLLQLKPGNKMARELQASLNAYGSRKKKLFDDKGASTQFQFRLLQRRQASNHHR